VKKMVLKVAEDFSKAPLQLGDVFPQFGGQLTIVDLEHETEFGTFIYCEYIAKSDDGRADSQWERRNGAAPGPDRALEIIGSIHIPGYRNMMAGPGFFIKNHDRNEVIGMSFDQAWKLIFHEGARNSEASSSRYHQFSTRLIDSIDGLPAFDSHYWKIPAYDLEGVPFAPLTTEALAEINKGMSNAVHGLVREVVQKWRPENEDMAAIPEMAALLKSANKLVVLSGAGISTGSGIPDYRSSIDSMWHKHPDMVENLYDAASGQDSVFLWKALYEFIEETLRPITPFPTHEALLTTIKSLKPNGGHRFLAWLESGLNKDVTVITQNVDGLHQKAGNSSVINMHGNILECVCPACGQQYPLVKVLGKDCVPACECGNALRPDVVFFGDVVKQYEEALEAVREADVILVIGTSLQVYPFNQLLHAKREGAKTVLINGTAVDHQMAFDYTAYGDISRLCYEIKRMMT
jgi:NAD-dependent SIR2 family protein deacetylase